MTDGTRERIEAALGRLERGFRKRWENNPDFRKSLVGKDRDILIDLRDHGAWTIQVRDGNLEGIVEGRPPGKANVRIEADAEHFLAIFDGTLSPAEAYLRKKVKVKAPIRDILLVKSFMGG